MCSEHVSKVQAKVWCLRLCEVDIHLSSTRRCTQLFCFSFSSFPSCGVQFETRWARNSGKTNGNWEPVKWKNRFLLHCSWGLWENVVRASFHRWSLWGREKVREDDPDVPGWKHTRKALPLCFVPWDYFSLLPARFIRPVKMNCKSMLALYFWGNTWWLNRWIHVYRWFEFSHPAVHSHAQGFRCQ